ncbi:LptA/OstA family protein [Edaphobacter bradus]|uniref:LptA/OstA family protein n=1 Tax=Edaphobacter bradus TaxID=2259016 RepID=UPI0021DFA2D8|nr:LptA/OstA family protein [Edaphobacter bradus]
MRVSVERLRVGLLAGAGLLVGVTAVFLGYGHFRAHRFLTELPKKLGADIRQETNAITWSQTVKGRTVFTLHAAKAVQHQNGAYTLHDVGIVLYGQGQSNRVDRIYGKEFEYDQNAGVIKAMGEVHIDLQAPAAADAKGKMDYAAGADLKSGNEWGKGEDDAEKDERLIHVKTSGLVFMRELGVAATDQDIEFAYGGLTGHARGAEYNADSGVLVLQSAVKMNGLEHDRPVVLTAARAELDRLNHSAVLTQAKYVSVGAAGQTAEAQHVVVHTRNDGSAERVEAQGAVTLVSANTGHVVAERADVLLNEQSRLQSGRMFGGVKYVEEDAQRKAQGEAKEARGTFDAQGRIKQVVLSGAVALHERESVAAKQADDAKPLWSERELQAETVELALASDEAGRSLLKDAKASGDARLSVIDPAKKGNGTSSGTTSSAMAGDVLTAHFVKGDGRQRLSEVHGDGHTALKQVGETGVEDTSSGDSLEVKFKDAAQAGRGRAAAAGSAGVQGGGQIASAVQQGNVVLTRRPVAKAGESPDPQRATAKRAAYDGDTQTMTLTGGIALSDNGGVLWADHATMERVSGDATVEGGVKASYRQSAQGEVVHVMAQRAELKKAANEALFYGAAEQPARLWQGGSQVEAPVLEFSQKAKRLVAHGAGQGAPMAVHTVLVSSGTPAQTKAPATMVKSVAPAGLRGPSVVRIASREMTYSDEKREADFTGGVLVESADGRMHGQQAVAHLQPVDAKMAGAAAGKDGLLGGSVERVVVTGQIRMEQPGRSATGERLVYTAADGMFVLTGGPGTPPKVVDETRGTVTGTELRFHTGDESIVISNGEDNGSGQRVHTETRVKR